KTYKVGAITVETPWSRATPGGAQVAGGFMRITNTGKEPDRLVGGSFAGDGRFQVHELSMADNVMRMRSTELGIDHQHGETVELQKVNGQAETSPLTCRWKSGHSRSRGVSRNTSPEDPIPSNDRNLPGSGRHPRPERALSDVELLAEIGRELRSVYNDLFREP